MSAYRQAPAFAKAAPRASLWRRIKAWWRQTTPRRLALRRAGWCVRCRMVVERWPTFGFALHVRDCACSRVVDPKQLTLAGAFDAMANGFTAASAATKHDDRALLEGSPAAASTPPREAGDRDMLETNGRNRKLNARGGR